MTHYHECHDADINECDNLTNCSIADNKECFNTDGSYSCNCIPGYFKTEPNGILCKGKYISCMCRARG